MKKRAWLFWLGAILIVAASAFVLLMPRSQEVQVLTVERADAERTLAVNGRIRPRQSVDVQSPVAGTLIHLPYDVGDRVSAGVAAQSSDPDPSSCRTGRTSA